MGVRRLGSYLSGPRDTQSSPVVGAEVEAVDGCLCPWPLTSVRLSCVPRTKRRLLASDQCCEGCDKSRGPSLCCQT